MFSSGFSSSSARSDEFFKVNLMTGAEEADKS